MNKRIRKKKAKQQLIRAISGLVEAAEEMQREQERRTRQAGISYIKYIEAVRERQYGIMPVYTPLFEKEGALTLPVYSGKQTVFTGTRQSRPLTLHRPSMKRSS